MRCFLSATTNYSVYMSVYESPEAEVGGLFEICRLSEVNSVNWSATRLKPERNCSCTFFIIRQWYGMICDAAVLHAFMSADSSQHDSKMNAKVTRNSSGDEIANVNFLYDDIVHALQNTIDSCINSATDRRGYVLERRFTKLSSRSLIKLKQNRWAK